MAKRTRRQHIIPRSYMKRFAVGEQVYVHNFRTGKSYVNNLSDAGCIDDFYTVKTTDNSLDDCIETKLLGKIEGLVDPVIGQLVNEKRLPSIPEKGLLCNYLALMYTRGLWFRQILHEVYEHVALEWLERLTSDEEFYNKTMNEVGELSNGIEDIPFEEARSIRDKLNVTVDVPRTFSVKEMMLHAGALVGVFYAMNFNVLYIPVYSYAKFITSDRPFVMMGNCKTRKKWIESPEAEVYFPLSSTICLMMNFKDQPVMKRCERHEVAFFNFHVANEGKFLAISEEEDFIWRYDAKIIRHSSRKLVELLSKREHKHLASENAGMEMKSETEWDVNRLRGRDE